MELVSAAKVLESVDLEQVEAFAADFNKSMADPSWVKNWRCGGEHDEFWRVSCSGDHNEATTARIRELLAAGGWRVGDSRSSQGL